MREETMKIFEKKVLPIIIFFEIIPIYFIIGIVMAIVLRGLLFGDWQSWLSDWMWVMFAMLLMIAYLAKECRIIILKNELRTKNDELKKKKTALTIAMRDHD